MDPQTRYTVATESTTLPGGTDNQAFCYDEQNRLTWAGSTGTPPCAGTAASTSLPPGRTWYADGTWTAWPSARSTAWWDTPVSW